MNKQNFAANFSKIRPEKFCYYKKEEKWNAIKFTARTLEKQWENVKSRRKTVCICTATKLKTWKQNFGIFCYYCGFHLFFWWNEVKVAKKMCWSWAWKCCLLLFAFRWILQEKSDWTLLLDHIWNPVLWWNFRNNPGFLFKNK